MASSSSVSRPRQGRVTCALPEGAAEVSGATRRGTLRLALGCGLASAAAAAVAVPQRAEAVTDAKSWIYDGSPGRC